MSKRPRAAILSIAYALCVLATVLVTSVLGDKAWFPTVLLFAPRWVYALPILVVLPIAIRGRLKAVSLGTLAVTAFLLLWFNDFHVSKSIGGDESKGENRLRVVTYNVGGGDFHPETLVGLVNLLHADVVGLEECQHVDVPAFAAKGYAVREDQSKICLITKLPIVKEDVRDPHDMWAVGGAGGISRYELDWNGHIFSVELVHLETVREGLEAMRWGFWRSGWQGPREMRANIQQRATESQLALEWSKRSTLPTIVMGDFNIPTDSAIYRNTWKPFHNALSENGNGNLVTKATKYHGIRIDHVLFGDGLKCQKSFVAEDLGMDHRPVVADFTWSGP